MTAVPSFISVSVPRAVRVGGKMTWLGRSSATTTTPRLFSAKPATVFNSNSDLFTPAHFYWKTYFDAGYYICIIPYRFQWDEDSQEWIPVKNYFQMAIHALLVLSTQLTAFAMEINQQRPPVSDPLFYVEFIFSVATVCYAWTLFYVLWTKQKEIRTVLNFKPCLSEDEVLLMKDEPIGKFEDKFLETIPRKSPNYAIEYASALLGDIGIGVMGASAAGGRNYSKIQRFWKQLKTISGQPSFLPNCMIYFFLLQPLCTNGLRKLEIDQWDTGVFMVEFATVAKRMFLLDEVPTPDSSLTWFAIFLNFYYRCAMGFVDMLSALTALYFWRLVTEFSAKYNSESQLSVHEVMIHHKILKSIMMSINRAVGPIIFVFSIMTIPFFCAVFVDFFKTFETFNRLHWIIYSIYYFGTLRLAASGARKMENLYNWFFIGNHFVKCSQTELDVYLNEMSKDEITLKAGFIGLRDKHIRSILGLILTYSFVLMQFQQQAAQRAGAGMSTTA